MEQYTKAQIKVTDRQELKNRHPTLNTLDITITNTEVWININRRGENDSSGSECYITLSEETFKKVINFFAV